MPELLIGDALLGENKRLLVQFFERIEMHVTQFKQLMREANLADGTRAITDMEVVSNQLVTYIEGKMSQYTRSSFTKKPTEH